MLQLTLGIEWCRSPLKVDQRLGENYRLHLQIWKVSQANRSLFVLLAGYFMQVSCLTYTWTVKKEATYSFETSVNFYRTTQGNIPWDRILHNYFCENLMSCIVFLFFFYFNEVSEGNKSPKHTKFWNMFLGNIWIIKSERGVYETWKQTRDISWSKWSIYIISFGAHITCNLVYSPVIGIICNFMSQRMLHPPHCSVEVWRTNRTESSLVESSMTQYDAAKQTHLFCLEFCTPFSHYLNGVEWSWKLPL